MMSAALFTGSRWQPVLQTSACVWSAGCSLPSARRPRHLALRAVTPHAYSPRCRLRSERGPRPASGPPAGWQLHLLLALKAPSFHGSSERPQTRGARAAATAGEHGLQTPPLSVWSMVRVVLGDLHLHVPSVSAASLAGHKQPLAPGLQSMPLAWPSHQSDTAGLSLAAGQCTGLRPCPVGHLLCGALL